MRSLVKCQFLKTDENKATKRQELMDDTLWECHKYGNHRAMT